MATPCVAKEVKKIRAVLGREVPKSSIARALSLTGNNPDLAINMILDDPAFLAPAGVLNQEAAEEGQALGLPWKVKQGDAEWGAVTAPPNVVKQDAACEETTAAACPKLNREEPSVDVVIPSGESRFNRSKSVNVVKKEERKVGSKGDAILVSDEEDYGVNLTKTHFSPYLNPRPITCIKPENVTDRALQVDPHPGEVEDGDFPEEPDWFLVGRTNVMGLSTCRGRNKVALDEIVYFSFPSADSREKFGRRKWVSVRAAIASSEIVRFSTKRCGEIGKLPVEWSRCLVPLVHSSKVKVCGRCVYAPENISLMQDIVLYVSFYIHSSVFFEGDKSSWSLDAPSNLGSTTHPLPTLFKLLKLKPFKRAEFTPEELSSRKRSLNISCEGMDNPSQVSGHAKRRKGGDTPAEQDQDEQAISESALNKLVGVADLYDLEEADPPSTLQCRLHPYQKQALYWMSELEKGFDVDKAAKTLHPCWEAYHIRDKRAPAVYVNVFTGEATTQFPSATQIAGGGILADAMGLGKTVMTIALILSAVGRENHDMNDSYKNHRSQKRASEAKSGPTIKGGTLVVCPMALLGQWKDELEAHSEPGAISIFVHYGGDRTSNPRVIASHDVVLTTYGVLSSAYKHESQSIFHQIEWYRVVLDEAHTIKSSKSQVAQSAFALTSSCRWCVTGTPLQNGLEDLYSLLRFLRVEPWCNWGWWYKLVQKPYEEGDERGPKLIKGILRPLMLRRTKETRDKDGRPILVLPPVDTQMVECEQSEAERVFYDCLFQKSKVKFDQFVAEGKVLQNYASILELLLRLRQCCNHPVLVVSRADAQQSADLDRIALDLAACAAATPAFVEEVVEGIRRGEVSECPICFESASDDPVLTPCMHRMCRECLLSSWRAASGGPCPICRRGLTQKDLRVLPGVGRLWADVEGNWKESSKVAKLLGCLEEIRWSGLGEKSIVFSQWTSFLDLLEIALKARGIGFLRYDGKLNQKQRECVLKEFNESSDITVMLMSLKAGGVGLNLTAASNVFIMDPWWNPAVEEQAIMRIHRIGQRRQVRVRRFIVNGTVEERLQQVQARKQRMIEGALTDEEVRTARIEELKRIFK